MRYSVNEIKNILDSNNFLVSKSIINLPECNIEHCLTDSRQVSFIDTTLFVALETNTGSGHKYVEDLYKQGVKNFLISIWDEKYNDFEANFFLVDNTLKALQALAMYHRDNFTSQAELFRFPIIGVTGSNGKTIVKEWLYQLLKDKFNCCRSPKSYNSQIGVPLSVLNLNKEHNLGIFEAGISQTNEMERLAMIIKPKIGIITNIGNAHNAGFHSIDEKIEEKIKLFYTADTVICPSKYGIEKYFEKKLTQLITWGINDKKAVINVSKITEGNDSIVKFEYNNRSYEYKIPFTDDASVENALNAIICCVFLSISDLKTESLEPVAMRLELKQGINNCTLINDSYNSDLGGLSIAIDFLNSQSRNTGLSKTLILSDIAQTGTDDKSLYSAVADLIKEKGIDRFIGVGEISNYKNLFPSTSTFYERTIDLINAQPTFINEIILIKGARKFEFEKITNYLSAKSHETIMEVNLSALVDNFKHLRSFLKNDTKAVAMIKADAYGCGALAVGQTLSHYNCDYFGVAVADEGVELRKAGIKTPIIIMNPELNTFDLMIKYRLEPEIYSFKLLKSFANYTENEGINNFPIHIKIDTGMHRLGFEEKEIDSLIDFLKNNKSLKVESAFSHLVAAEDKNEDEFTLKQIETFKRITDKLQNELNITFLRHILNTSGIQRFSEYQMEMVRMGIGLYGIGIDENSPIRPVATLKTRILQIKELGAEETVGYNRKGKLNKASRIAAIPIGYADGLSRAFGNGNGYVMINSKKAPFVGNICMDVCMIDITDIENVNEGDMVTIFGTEPSISELAKKTNTIPYEILTSISKRVKRIYYQE
jgi:alanine racemase